MANVSLSKLRSFVRVAEVRQFRKAAEDLRLSQPALSGHVRDLERELGVPLLRRTTRSLHLTAEGERFLHRARKVLDDIESAVLDVRDHAALRRGRVIVTATPSVASSILPRAVVAFRAKYPGVRVHIVEDGSSGVEQRLEMGEADIGVGPRPHHRTDLSFSLLFRDNFVGVAAVHHPLSKCSRVRLSELIKYPLLVTHAETSIRTSVESILRSRGLELDSEHRVAQHQTLVALVAAGLGVALLPSLALGMLDLRNVVTFPVTRPRVTREIGILQRTGGTSSSAASEFIEMLG